MNLQQLMAACPNLTVVSVGEKPAEYYAERTGPDRYTLRQTRYRRQLEQGSEHPHDVMAVGFTAAGLREMISAYLPTATCDLSALPNENGRLLAGDMLNVTLIEDPPTTEGSK
jgi:hypothetical protein